MKKQKAFIVGTRDSGHIQPGKVALILGVCFITPENLPPRVCYQIRHEDGKEDFVPLSDFSDQFLIISEEQAKSKTTSNIVW